MKETQRPLFVARDTYRARRTMDAARLLPVLGIIFFLGLLPLLRANVLEDDPSGAISRSVLFMFGVWVVLIGLAAVLARPLRKIDQQDSLAGNTASEE